MPGGDSREDYLARKIEATRLQIQSFRLSPQEFASYLDVWRSSGWPLSQLTRDHYGSKILHDNRIFPLMKHYGHTVHFDDDRGLCLLYKASNAVVAQLTPLFEVLPTLSVKATPTGEWLLDGFVYSRSGLQRHYHYQFNAKEFESYRAIFRARGWPLGLLLADHFACKVFYENGLFWQISFFGHSWEWDAEDGLRILYRPRGATDSRLTPWCQIMTEIDLILTPEGFHYLDGVAYTEHGLVFQHIWKWQTLTPSYRFPAACRPAYAYLDVVTGSWGHSGPPGIGVDGTSQGHVYCEICDVDGNLYSVGQYPSPESLVNILATPTKKLRAVLFSPDIYMTANGERSITRYHLGVDETGRRAVAQLLDFLHGIQAYRVDPLTGSVWTCDAQQHNFLDFNCTDFALALARYACASLGARLVRPADDTPLPGPRTFLDRTDEAAPRSLGRYLWLHFRMTLYNWVFTLLLCIAFVFGAGTEHVHNRAFHEPLPLVQDRSLRGMMQRTWRGLQRRCRFINYPMRLRIQQLYSAQFAGSRAIFQAT